MGDWTRCYWTALGMTKSCIQEAQAPDAHSGPRCQRRNQLLCNPSSARIWTEFPSGCGCLRRVLCCAVLYSTVLYCTWMWPSLFLWAWLRSNAQPWPAFGRVQAGFAPPLLALPLPTSRSHASGNRRGMTQSHPFQCRTVQYCIRVLYRISTSQPSYRYSSCTIDSQDSNICLPSLPSIRIPILDIHQKH
ncbi:hypothetical protein BCV70DRAFT_55130 [Testicularia cyperi]|uniref:Uncharacterized protein n=1 Tax=Testicularia cyperi TaxID=1882483 RepID=A0A317XVT2_9BASI|nr:hypothetical protein BCV70DRAFT_55130 [Testicularia cyperi]